MAAARAPAKGASVAAATGSAHVYGIGEDFSAIRAELGLPVDFPAAALSEVEQTVAQPAVVPGRVDATDLPLVSVDPAGAKDMDQAMLIRRRLGGGYRVYYAIADAAVFVPPGGALDREVRRRGQTLYLPDGAVPLHPTLMSEGAASLLPEQVRLAALWTIDLDSDAAPVGVDVRRAVVRSVAALDFDAVTRSIATGTPHPSIALLPEVGRLRREQAMRRGAIEIGLPEQQIEPASEGGWRLVLRPRLLIEEFNAEISLLTGMCAAEIMLSAGIGVLRTVPDPEPEAIAALRRSAARLGMHWPDDCPLAEVLGKLDSERPEALALHSAATRLLRGAGYTAFDNGAPTKFRHAGIGAAYAHVTAPLRRLVDRYATELCLAISAGRDIPEWVLAALPQLPSAMGNSDRNAGQVERACIAQVQAWALADQIGSEFTATILRAGEDNEPAGNAWAGHPDLGNTLGRAEEGGRASRGPTAESGGTPAPGRPGRAEEGGRASRGPTAESGGTPAPGRPGRAEEGGRASHGPTAESGGTPAPGRPGRAEEGGRASHGPTSEVFISDPPIIARCLGNGVGEGQSVRVRLVEADPVRRTVLFEVA